jgi:preprotein translocase subunit SecA
MTSRWWPGFGYLRDHLATSPTQAVQRRGGAGAALFDRADLVLANEARTPLIVGGKGSGKEDTLARITVRGYYRQYAKLGGLCFGAWPSTLGVLEHRWGLEMVEVPATVATGQARPGRPRERDARVTELPPRWPTKWPERSSSAASTSAGANTSPPAAPAPGPSPPPPATSSK